MRLQPQRPQSSGIRSNKKPLRMDQIYVSNFQRNDIHIHPLRPGVLDTTLYDKICQ
jgi:hypothetical protein